MPIFDITPTILNSDRDFDFYNRDFRNDRLSRMKMLRLWLTENVGEYYGCGTNGEDNTTIHIGSGWEIFQIMTWKLNGMLILQMNKKPHCLH